MLLDIDFLSNYKLISNIIRDQLALKLVDVCFDNMLQISCDFANLKDCLNLF